MLRAIVALFVLLPVGVSAFLLIPFLEILQELSVLFTQDGLVAWAIMALVVLVAWLVSVIVKLVQEEMREARGGDSRYVPDRRRADSGRRPSAPSLYPSSNA